MNKTLNKEFFERISDIANVPEPLEVEFDETEYQVAVQKSLIW